MLTRKRKAAQFFSAIQSKDFEKLDVLLSQYPLQEQLKKYGKTALEIAIEANQVGIIKKLTNAGCVIQKQHLDLAKKHHPTSDALKECLIKPLILNVIYADDDKTMQDVVQCHWSAVEMFRDSSGYDILKKTIKHHALKVLDVLFSDGGEKIKSIFHREEYDRESALSFAEKSGNTKVVAKLREAIRNHYENSIDNLSLPLGPLRLKDFLHHEDVKPKGLALLLNYHYEKKSSNENDPKVFFALGGNALFRAIQLFIESKENNLTLLYAGIFYNEMGGHRNVCRIEKYQKRIYIILMDSYRTRDSDIPSVFSYLKNRFLGDMPEKIPLITFCMNVTNQQTDQYNCSFFSLKNISKLLITPSLAKEIVEHHVIKTWESGNLTYADYRLPARFMHVAQSYDRLIDYIDKNIEENISSIRIAKDNHSESLSQYAFHKRKKFGVETPVEIPNRNYSPIKKEGSPFVYKNYTIDYFAEKYRQQVIPSIFNNKSQKELRDIIHRHDASCLTEDALRSAKKQRV